MTKAKGSQHGMSYVAESIYGTTPGPSPAPTMLRLPHTDTTLGLTKGELVPATAREDGQIAESVHGNHRTPGNIDFEFVYGAQDDLLAALCRGAWSNDELKVGVLAPSFTIERRMTDIGRYAKFAGCVIDTLALNIAQSPDGLFATGTFGVIGRTMTMSNQSLGTPSEQGANTAYKTFAGSLTEGGNPLAIVTALTLNINNSYALRPIVGSHLSVEPTRGRFDITGQITAYFDDQALVDKFLNETESSIVVTLTDAAGNQLQIDLPRIKYNGADFPKSGEDDIILTLPFRPLRDDTEESPVVFTRTAA